MLLRTRIEGEPAVRDDAPETRDWTTGRALPAAMLRRRCDPAEFGFATTDDVPDLAGLVGQERAVDAVRLGIGMRRQGFNVFAFGPPGTGKHTLVENVLERQAVAEPPPPDWCFVNNFADPRRPLCLKLPSGRAVPLRDAMRRLVTELRAALPAAFEREDYRARREVVDEQFKHRHEEAFGALQKKAEDKGIALIRTPMGLALAPVHNGEVIKPEVFQRLAAEDRARISADMQALQSELEATVRRIPEWEREHRDAVRKLNRDTTAVVVNHLLQDVRSAFADLPQVGTHLDAVERDILEHAEDFIAPIGPEGPGGPPPDGPATEMPAFRRYQVNVLVDNSALKGAPIVYEDDPTHQRLVGRIEHMARFGALFTDFNLVVPGALHKANGGYLVLDAQRLLAGNFAWELLKRALRAREIPHRLDRAALEFRQHRLARSRADPARPQGRADRAAAALLPPHPIRSGLRRAVQDRGGVRRPGRPHAGQRRALCASHRDLGAAA